MDKEELQEILIEHKKWVDSDGGEGKCANLQGADLWGALFSAGFYQVLRRVHGSDSVF